MRRLAAIASDRALDTGKPGAWQALGRSGFAFVRRPRGATLRSGTSARHHRAATAPTPLVDRRPLADRLVASARMRGGAGARGARRVRLLSPATSRKVERGGAARRSPHSSSPKPRPMPRPVPQRPDRTPPARKPRVLRVRARPGGGHLGSLTLGNLTVPCALGRSGLTRFQARGRRRHAGRALRTPRRIPPRRSSRPAARRPADARADPPRPRLVRRCERRPLQPSRPSALRGEPRDACGAMMVSTMW